MQQDPSPDKKWLAKFIKQSSSTHMLPIGYVLLISPNPFRYCRQEKTTVEMWPMTDLILIKLMDLAATLFNLRSKKAKTDQYCHSDKSWQAKFIYCRLQHIIYDIKQHIKQHIIYVIKQLVTAVGPGQVLRKAAVLAQTQAYPLAAKPGSQPR